MRTLLWCAGPDLKMRVTLNVFVFEWPNDDRILYILNFFIIIRYC